MSLNSKTQDNSGPLVGRTKRPSRANMYPAAQLDATLNYSINPGYEKGMTSNNSKKDLIFSIQTISDPAQRIRGSMEEPKLNAI